MVVDKAIDGLQVGFRCCFNRVGRNPVSNENVALLVFNPHYDICDSVRAGTN